MFIIVTNMNNNRLRDLETEGFIKQIPESHKLIYYTQIMRKMISFRPYFSQCRTTFHPSNNTRGVPEKTWHNYLSNFLKPRFFGGHTLIDINFTLQWPHVIYNDCYIVYCTSMYMSC